MIATIIVLSVLVLILGFSLKSTRDELSGVRQSYYKSEQEKNILRSDFEKKIMDQQKAYKSLQEKYSSLFAENQRHIINLQTVLKSNTTAAPWLAGMMADFLTYDLEVEAKKLDWGANIQREKKVASIRALRDEAREKITAAKYATYQLAYLLELYPSLSDVIETDYSELELSGTIPDSDPVRTYLSFQEWNTLDPVERDQLALDRYIQSRSKSKWQIGRDYELSVAFELMSDGFSVDTTGSYLKLEDMGRDIIAQKNEKTYIIQCKYWSADKTIHEKHIFQLYGSAISYALEQNKTAESIIPVFITNIFLSDKAKQVADYLHVRVYDNHHMTEFPRIKCNIGKTEYGAPTKIYHLPMDAQYDCTKINKPGEFYAYTVKEATEKGFRRAFRWYGEQERQ